MPGTHCNPLFNIWAALYYMKYRRIYKNIEMSTNHRANDSSSLVFIRSADIQVSAMSDKRC
jgi:hypothetical protein